MSYPPSPCLMKSSNRGLSLTCQVSPPQTEMSTDPDPPHSTGWRLLSHPCLLHSVSQSPFPLEVSRTIRSHFSQDSSILLVLLIPPVTFCVSTHPAPRTLSWCLHTCVLIVSFVTFSVPNPFLSLQSLVIPVFCNSLTVYRSFSTILFHSVLTITLGGT